MTERPTAVTVFGWFWRVGGIMGMIFAWPLAIRGREWLGDLATGPFWQLPPILLFLYCFLASLLGLVLGNGLLKGRNWSRVLALAYCFVAILLSFGWYEKTPLFWFNLLVNLVFTLVMWFFLFRPHVTAHFKGEVLLGEGGTA